MAHINKQLDNLTFPGNKETPDLRAFMGNPVYSSFLDFFKSGREEQAKQASDSTRIFEDKRMFDPRVFLQYPNSPTANNHSRAVCHLIMASEKIEDFNKDSVENLKDCEILRSAFENIVYGHICENSMFGPFHPPEYTSILIDQYLMLKPDDIFAEYTKQLILWRTLSQAQKGKNLLSDFEYAKLSIKSAEQLAYKLSLDVDSLPGKRIILIDIYYCLGAKYVSTSQPERALDSFQKCFDLDNSNYSALYGIAYMHMKDEPMKAIEFFRKFIKMAPECDKQYPNAYYMIASLYVTKGNAKEALRYCSLAEDAEKKRLPFLGPVDIPQKDMMQQMKSMIPQIEKMKSQKKIKPK
ncbi:unnamed protein product [Mytilus coruscus]|uniref:Uncharacterized protein n=1 Tax=Mytilus coruscus TaxID=42192 RepID=A0A6J8A053_MYTCO|nr:unnamed protein product [Mytilus coruscus]